MVLFFIDIYCNWFITKPKVVTKNFIYNKTLNGKYINILINFLTINKIKINTTKMDIILLKI